MRKNIGLYHGKRKDNGEWVEGYYVYDESGQTTENPTAYICHLNTHPCGYSLIPYEVDPETVGQYTGLTDKNGKKIFEDDVLDCTSGLYERCEVIYNEFCSAFQLMCADGFSDFFLCSINHKEMEVIGNIHDNPELLEEMETET